MANNKDLMEDLTENNAVQTGGATLLAAGMTQLGVSTIGLGALSTGSAGVILATLGPVGLAIGGVILFGGIVSTINKRMKK